MKISNHFRSIRRNCCVPLVPRFVSAMLSQCAREGPSCWVPENADFLSCCSSDTPRSSEDTMDQINDFSQLSSGGDLSIRSSVIADPRPPIYDRFPSFLLGGVAVGSSSTGHRSRFYPAIDLAALCCLCPFCPPQNARDGHSISVYLRRGFTSIFPDRLHDLRPSCKYRLGSSRARLRLLAAISPQQL
jgi:hypothetical protein